MVAWAPVGLGQETQPVQSSTGQAGFEDKFGFGGPEGVGPSLIEADALRDALYDWPFFDGYFDWKGQVANDYGVSFGVQFYGLFQQASESLPGEEDDAFGNIFRFLGKWTLFERDNGNLGRIEWRLESRSDWFGSRHPDRLVRARVSQRSRPVSPTPTTSTWIWPSSTGRRASRAAKPATRWVVSRSTSTSTRSHFRHSRGDF